MVLVMVCDHGDSGAGDHAWVVLVLMVLVMAVIMVMVSTYRSISSSQPVLSPRYCTTGVFAAPPGYQGSAAWCWQTLRLESVRRSPRSLCERVSRVKYMCVMIQ